MIKKLLSITMATMIAISTLAGIATPSLATTTSPTTPNQASSVTAKEVIKDVRVRKALTLAIDRKSLVDNVLLGAQVPSAGFVPLGLKLSNGVEFRKAAGNYGIDPNKANLAEAKRLLAEAGFPDGKGFPTLTILYNTSEIHKSIAEAVQAMWEQNLGVHSELVNQEWNVFQDTRHQGTFEVSRAGWIADYEDPMTFLDLWTSYSANNDAHWYNPEYDKIIEASKLASGSERDKLMLKAEKMIMDDQIILPFYHYIRVVQISDRTKNVFINHLGQYFLDKASTPNGILRLNLGGEPLTIDPGLNSANIGGYIISQTFEGLMREDASGLRLGAAKSYTKSEDGLTYTFKIRDNAKWSDGKPLTANDFEYAWKRVLNPTTASEYGFQMFYIKGAQEYYEGKGKLSDVGIKALDSKTLVVELNGPTPYFLNLTSFYPFMPVRKDMVAKNPENWAKTPKLAVSNGPFSLASYKTGDTIKLVPNKYWWRKSEVKLKTIEAPMIVDASTALTAFESSDLDINDLIPTEEISYLKKQGKTLKILPYLGTYYYIFNVGDAK